MLCVLSSYSYRKAYKEHEEFLCLFAIWDLGNLLETLCVLCISAVSKKGLSF